MSRLDDLHRFYAVLGRLAVRTGGPRKLGDSHGRQDWPTRGVYFFFEPGEARTSSGSGLRVIRVGTHALTAGSRTTLWNRLAQHRGVPSSGGGNHRGSIFRLLVGEALLARGLGSCESWGVASSLGEAARRSGRAREEVEEAERPVEIQVSRVIREMPLLWVRVDDPPGERSQRGFIERNAIALLSNWEKEPLDPPGASWLGHRSGRDRVRTSGLWNSHHVDEGYDRAFLGVLEAATEGS